jgi:hypothetical protein
MSEIGNPLQGLEVGSCTPAGSGKPWGKSVIRGKITRTIVQPTKWASMQGQSDYAYSKQMNQGSTGIAGSYGVSGIAKASAAVSAYFGNSSAQSGRSMKVNYQIMVLGGTEYVNFEDLTPELLIASLSEAAKSSIGKALEAYTQLNEAVDKLSLKEPKLFSVLEQPDQYENEHRLYLAWLDAVSAFRRNYGDGVVVQVAWGGIGIVSMEIANTSSESVWKYGGEANFSYAAPGSSVSVGATYDGNQSKGQASVTVECRQFSSGSPVQAQTDEWFRTVSGQAFKDLVDVKVLDKAPDMTAKAALLQPPEFVKPKQDEKLAEKIGKIKNVEGLKLYAKAAAYDKAKKENKDLTLEDFLKEAEKPADVAPLVELGNDVENDQVIDRDAIRLWGLFDDMVPNALRSGKPEEPAKNEASASPFDGYTPIGAWIANWDHLFPWLATGFLNSIQDLKTIKPSLAYRMMLQDFLALAKLYYIADSCKFSPTLFRDAPQLVGELKQYADSFAQAAALLQSELTDKSKKQGSAPDANFFIPTMKNVVGRLNDSTRAIYKKWCEIGFLRKCELGLGIMGGDSTTESAAGNMSPYVDETGKSSVKKLQGRWLDGRTSLLDMDWGWDAQGWGDPNSSNRSRIFTVERKKCGFDPARPNPDYSAFAGFYKVLPLIVPIGNEMKIYVFGPGNNVLGYLTQPPQWDRPSDPTQIPFQWDLFFSKNPGIKDSFVFVGDDGSGTLHLGMDVAQYFRFVPWDPVEFTPNATSKTLEARGLKLYPIPFSAAQGVSDWKGQSFSTNVASMTDLRSSLEQLASGLKRSNAWGFSSDGWPEGWDITDYYHDADIPKQYMGLLEEKEFPAR